MAEKADMACAESQLHLIISHKWRWSCYVDFVCMNLEGSCSSGELFSGKINYRKSWSLLYSLLATVLLKTSTKHKKLRCGDAYVKKIKSVS